MINLLEHSSMNNNDLKQLRTRILVHLDNQQWIEYYVGHHNFKYHKLNGPALIYDNGSKSWLINGIYQRANGPVVIRDNSSKYWH